MFAEINCHVVYEPMRCIRSNRYKLIRYFGNYDRLMPANCDDSPSKDVLLEAGYFDLPREREMLFDLYSDPSEQRNRITDKRYRRIYRDLDKRLRSWMEETGDPLLQGGVPKPAGARVGIPAMISPAELH